LVNLEGAWPVGVKSLQCIQTYVFKLIKSFAKGKCHPAMTSMVELCTDNTLHLSKSSTTRGSRRPSVFGAYLQPASGFQLW